MLIEDDFVSKLFCGARMAPGVDKLRTELYEEIIKLGMGLKELRFMLNVQY